MPQRLRRMREGKAGDERLRRITDSAAIYFTWSELATLVPITQETQRHDIIIRQNI